MVGREELVKIIGSQNVADGSEALEEYTKDLSFVQRIRPGSVVKADSAEAVQAIVKWANETRTPLMAEDLDEGVGMILDEIEKLGIRENTYVIYLADNGTYPTKDPSNINGPIHGWKATLWQDLDAAPATTPTSVNH